MEDTPNIEPGRGRLTYDKERKTIVSQYPLDKAHLGLATTRKLLDELRARIEMHALGGLDYRTVDGEKLAKLHALMEKPAASKPLLFRHEPLTRAEAEALMRRSDNAERRRAEQMPDEKSAIRALFDAWYRLKELGWKEGCYCPKDGSSFEVCMLGSTGIFAANYSGKWPDGYVMVSDEHDAYVHRTGDIMWRPAPHGQSGATFPSPPKG